MDCNLFLNRPETRDIPFAMRLTPSEAQLLRQMAQEAQLSRSGIVRHLIRQALSLGKMERQQCHI